MKSRYEQHLLHSYWTAAALLLVLVLGGCQVYTATASDIQQANAGNIRIGTCAGTGSMYPLLVGGQRYTCRYDWDSIQVGDIITGYVHTSNGIRSRIHRATSPVHDNNGSIVAWRTWGDNNDKPDHQPIWISNYRGTLVQ